MAHGLLTTEEDAIAREAGWGLYWLHDGKRGWVVRPLPVANFAKPVDSAEKLMHYVNQQANTVRTVNGVTDPIHRVARRALQLAVNPPPIKTKKSK